MHQLASGNLTQFGNPFNPLTDGIQIKAVLMGGGIECPPSKNLENEATESCEGSK